MSWQSPGVVLDALLLTCRCWIDGWVPQESRPSSLWDEQRLTAGQWSAAAILCRLSTGWAAAVRAWRSLVTELTPSLVQSEPDMRGRRPGRLCRMNDAVVRHIASSCPALTALNLQETSVGDDAVRGDAMHELAQRCSRLCMLNLRGNVLHSEAIGALARLTSLEHLDLSKTRWWGPASANSSMASLAASAPLTRLNLTGCNDWLSVTAVAALARCTTLRALFLSTNTGVRDAAVCAIAASCVALTHLDLSNCHHLTDVGVAALAELPLRHLELTNCSGSSDEALVALARTGPRSCLLHLGLRAAFASEAALSELVTSCPSLTHLNISKCRAATDAALAAIARSCAALRVLDLRESDECTDAGLIAIAGGCPTLEELNCEECADVLTDAAAAAIVKGLKQLRTLNAAGSGDLSHIGLQTLRAIPVVTTC